MTSLVLIGVLAGILTTVTGVGGGMVALALLGVVMPQATALAITAAAFAVGNGHRALMYWRSVDRQVAGRFGVGLALGALGGALVVPSLPEWVLRGALVGVAGLALAQATRLRWQRRGSNAKAGDAKAGTAALASGAAKAAGEDAARGAVARGAARWSTLALVAAGVGVGVIGAGAGGAGVLVSPLLLSTGLRREPYVATVASCAIALNASRVVGYALGGLYAASMLVDVAVLAAALVLGNLLGRRVRQVARASVLDRVELAAPLVAIAVALLGG
ncbi:MAG: TSUP family transporter [Kofleriaceae bacterium]